MTSPESTSNSANSLEHDIFTKSQEIDDYLSSHEGEYARKKASLMLGRMATMYARTPVFVNAHTAIVPTEDGIGLGMGEFAGDIVGFTYGSINLLDSSVKQAVQLQLSTPGINGVEADDAESWRLNVIPPEMRQSGIDGFLVSVPILEGQRITRLGATSDEISVESITNPELKLKEYSYREFVQKFQDLSNNRPTMSIYSDGARMKALEQLMQGMNYECPFLGEMVAVDSDYIRKLKDDGSGKYQVLQGVVSGILRKFVSDVFQDYRTKEWRSDIQAVLYTADIMHQVQAGNMTPQQADKHPSTLFVPLSEPHALATNEGLKN